MNKSETNYRQVLALWPDDVREAWGRLANKFEDQGLSWREAELKAFNHVLAGLKKYESENPDKPISYKQRHVQYNVLKKYSKRFDIHYVIVEPIMRSMREELNKVVVQGGFACACAFDHPTVKEFAEMQAYSDSLPVLVDSFADQEKRSADAIAAQRRKIEAWATKQRNENQIKLNHDKAAPEATPVIGGAKKRRGGRQFKHAKNAQNFLEDQYDK